MFGVARHRHCLVDQKHRDAVLDAVRTAQPRVVEQLVVDQQQRPAIFRADEDAQQFFVEHDGRLADAEDDARVLAWLHRHARRQARGRLADAEAGPRLLGARILHLRLQLALVGQRVL